MGLIREIKRWWESLFQREAQDCFKVDTLMSGIMQREQRRWYGTYTGQPEWVCNEPGRELETINFAKKLCNETARLATLALGITVEGSARATWLQKQMDKYRARMMFDKCEYACAFGYIVIKPNGKSLDYVLPDNFVPTSCDDDGKINGGVFIDRQRQGKVYFTRLEYHRFENMIPVVGPVYKVSNRVYKSDADGSIGKEINIEGSPWAGLMPEATISGLEKPLFAVFGMPIANNLDVNSDIPVSFFSNAMPELKRLDIASQRMADEIDDSKKLVIVGDAFSMTPGQKITERIKSLRDRQGNELPRYIRAIPGGTEGDDYHEINPALNTEQRMTGINHYLDSVGVKCGYSTGQFVLNGRTGQVTATQVEADDRETIQTIKQIRDSLESATNDVLYALDKWADLYDITPVGAYEVNYDFGDITYNEDEDRERNWQYVQAGKYPFWRYLVRFEGYSEEDAKAIVAEMEAENKRAEKKGLFDEE